MPRSFLVKKTRADRIFRNYRSYDETMTSRDRVGTFVSLSRDRLPDLRITPDPTPPDGPLHNIKDTAAELFLRLPPTPIRPIADRVISGAFPLDATPFLSIESPSTCLPSPNDLQLPPLRPTGTDLNSAATKDTSCSSDPLSPVSPTYSSAAVAASEAPSPPRRRSAFQEGVTVAYTYAAFLVTDGRSRRPPTSPCRRRHRCSDCGKQYATSSNLSRHKQTHRSLDSQAAKRCPHCGKAYVSMPALSMHLLTHDLKYRCGVCTKAFSRPWLLQGHLRSHTGEKPFGCAHCGKAFADRSNLRAHMQTHAAFKVYRCGRCGKTFALKAYLNKHMEAACFKDVEDDCSSETSVWSV